MTKEFELTIGDGRILHVYDTAPGATDRLPVLWHHGTPNIGAPPEPLFDDRLGLRWISYDRPGYGGSTPSPAAPWPRRPATRAGSPTRWAWPASPSWATRAAPPTPWPARPCWASACWPY
ncbi:alpha/beta fold hydrolase [Nonomuraea rubra]|uniref:alpha/beta fold hydrolase n=1 Tax=Nonomuraea rubra TaxID=46180 RepID=UPI00361A9F0C